MTTPHRYEHVEGGGETPVTDHLRRPVVLLPVVALGLLAAVLLVVVRPWQGPPAAAPSPSPEPVVTLVSTGSTGTLVAVTEGPPVARMEVRVDLGSGTGGRVIGMVGPGLSHPIAISPALAPGTSSIALVGAVIDCAVPAGTSPADYGLQVEVSQGTSAVRVTRPLPDADAATWLGLLRQACRP